MATGIMSPQGALGTEALLKQLRWRYATKKFDPMRKISQDVWGALEDSLVLTPSSYGLQPWKFLVVSDAALRVRLRAASWDQPQVVEASHLVVFSHRKDLAVGDVDRWVRRIAVVRGLSPDALEGYRRTMLAFAARAGRGLDINAWAAHQLYISLGVFLTAAAVLGVDACPMEGIEPGRYDEILGLDKEGFHAMFVATAGYRAADDASAPLAKVRYEKEEVMGHL